MKPTLLILGLLPFLTCGDDTLRTIAQGKLQGTTRTARSGRPIYSFMKIPYAKQPLGDLRFKNPVRAEGWSGVRSATTDEGIICPTRNIYVKGMFYFKGQEDCLYLNVYTPLPEGDARLIPVMVYLHGGGWISGSGNSFYYPPDYLLDNDVVFVGFNYRLGALGFLSMEDSETPGNWGLKDQNLVLQWVQENIKSFGGDPSSVTIFGESAGGSSVHYHMLSPLSKGLFHKAISMSGTALTPWSLAQPGTARNHTLKLAKLLECPVANKEQMISCLRKQPIQRIIEQDVHFMEWISDPMIPFKPVVESLALPKDAFLPEQPESAIKGGRVADVPWMTGFTSGDGALRVSPIFDNDTLVKQLDENFNKIVPMSLFFRGKTKDDAATAAKVRRFYFGQEQISNENYMNVNNLWTDGWFGFGTHEAVRLHRVYLTAPVYYYYFAYRGSASFSSAFGDKNRNYQVSHGDDLIYLFPMMKDFPDHEYTNDDLIMMDTLTDIWTDFATYGKPTPYSSVWTEVKSTSLEYFHIGQSYKTMSKNLLRERFDFWSSLKIPFSVPDPWRNNGAAPTTWNYGFYFVFLLLSLFL